MKKLLMLAVMALMLAAWGITFIYQSYEITFYAAGRPTFTIPFSEAKPFLKPQAINLFLND